MTTQLDKAPRRFLIGNADLQTSILRNSRDRRRRQQLGPPGFLVALPIGARTRRSIGHMHQEHILHRSELPAEPDRFIIGMRRHYNDTLVIHNAVSSPRKNRQTPPRAAEDSYSAGASPYPPE